jgi:hypothetical protein
MAGAASCIACSQPDAIWNWCQRQPPAEFEADAAVGIGSLAPGLVRFDGTAPGRAAADHAADTVLRHGTEGARGAAHRLPVFDRQPLWLRRRHQGDLLQGVAAIRHLGRDRVVFTLVRERLGSDLLSFTCGSNIFMLITCQR